MGSYTQILYQLVWSTKHRIPCMDKENRERLFNYIAGILKEKRCHLYKINGVEDHLHIITNIHPMIAPAMLIKDIKVSSSILIKEENLFQDFTAWQVGYGAFTYSQDAKRNLINYVSNQEEHHKRESSREEYIRFLNEHNVPYEDKYIL